MAKAIIFFPVWRCPQTIFIAGWQVNNGFRNGKRFVLNIDIICMLGFVLLVQARKSFKTKVFIISLQLKNELEELILYFFDVY